MCVCEQTRTTNWSINFIIYYHTREMYITIISIKWTVLSMNHQMENFIHAHKCKRNKQTHVSWSKQIKFYWTSSSSSSSLDYFVDSRKEFQWHYFDRRTPSMQNWMNFEKPVSIPQYSISHSLHRNNKNTGFVYQNQKKNAEFKCFANIWCSWEKRLENCMCLMYIKRCPCNYTKWRLLVWEIYFYNIEF